MPTYLVERYWAGVTIERLLAALERGRRVAEEMGGEATPIRDVSCILIPGEEVVFSVYQAPSVAVVRQLNERVGLPVSRIVEAMAVTQDRSAAVFGLTTHTAPRRRDGHIMGHHRHGPPRFLAQTPSRRDTRTCCICPVAMFCPDCKQNLDDVPLDDPCPQCGGLRRSAVVTAGAALAAASAPTSTVTIGYNPAPGWTYQWSLIQRHLGRLREQYQGIDMRGNTDAEETVHALCLALNHIADWLYQDQATGLSKNTVDAHVSQHPASLGVCRAYANALKHMKRASPTQTVALITSIESGPNGQKVTIAYGAGNQTTSTYAKTDACQLAEQCERDWRDLLTQHGIAIPP